MRKIGILLAAAAAFTAVAVLGAASTAAPSGTAVAMKNCPTCPAG